MGARCPCAKGHWVKPKKELHEENMAAEE